MSEIMLEIDNVSKIYPGRRSLFGRSQPVTALNGVSLSVNKGESYGLVGESGSGKTTLTRSILHLETPTGGAIRFQGKDLQQLSAPELRRLRARIQIVFQDPYASLNPRATVFATLSEPLLVHKVCTPAEVVGRCGRLARAGDLGYRFQRHRPFRPPHAAGRPLRRRRWVPRGHAVLQQAPDRGDRGAYAGDR